MRQWKILEHTNKDYNKISLETEEGRRWVNAKDESQLRGYLAARWITNLEYLEGIILLKELEESKRYA